MEKGKHVVDVEKKTVTFGHETKTLDGSIVITTTFDLSNVDLKRLLKRAADAELIAWRAKSGIKGLTTVEAKELDNVTVDCSKVTERVKHVETEEEKKIKAAVQAIMSGKGGDTASLKELMDRAAALIKAREEAEMDAGEEM